MSYPAPSFTILPRLLASDAAVGDSLGQFPNSVCISDDTQFLVAGAATAGVSDQGAAYIFQRSVVTDQWNQIQKLPPQLPVFNASNYFGFATAIRNDNQVVAVGAPCNAGGSVYLYQYNRFNNQFDYFQTLKGSGTFVLSQTPNFGHSLCFSAEGNYMVSGAWGCNFAYAFTQSTTGIYVEQQRITGPLTNSRFGYTTKISGDGNYFLVGAPLATYTGVAGNRGMAHMYKKQTGTANWTLVQNISSPALTEIQFANVCDLSYDGSYAVFNYYYRSSVFFKKEAGTDFWTCVQAVTTSDTLNIGYGAMVSISYSGEQIAVGNRRLPTSDLGGVLYYQKLPTTDSWVLLSTLQGARSGSQVSERQGWSGMISRDGTYVVEGGPGAQSDRGAVYIFYRDWTKQMLSTQSINLVNLTSSSRITAALPKISTQTSQMLWLKDSNPNRPYYGILSVSTSGGDRLDGGSILTISTATAGAGFQFAHDGGSNWYTLDYYAGK